MLASLNGLEVPQADMEGAYLNDEPTEKLFTVCGPKFGEFAGRHAIICCALYGTKSAAASWRAAISKGIEGLGFEMCRADNDVWMRKGFNKAGEKVWEYVLVYSDDLLIVAQNPGEIAAQIDQHFKLKDGSIKAPKSYLVADMGKFTLPDKSHCFSLLQGEDCGKGGVCGLDQIEGQPGGHVHKVPTRPHQDSSSTTGPVLVFGFKT
jgi:hypothetical protein